MGALFALLMIGVNVATTLRWDIKSGLPFGKSLLVTLPTGRSWWTDISQFEIVFQIREDQDKDSNLIVDFSAKCVPVFMDADNVNVSLDLTGADTLLVTDGGFFDVIMSDIGSTNAIAFPIAEGTIRRRSVVSYVSGE